MGDITKLRADRGCVIDVPEMVAAASAAGWKGLELVLDEFYLACSITYYLSVMCCTKYTY